MEHTTKLIYGWLLFAISSLIFAGIFAFLVAMARTPVIQEIFPNTDYVRISLVGHVILSFVIWFMAFQGVLWTLTGTRLLNAEPFNEFTAWLGLFLSIGGTLFIITVSVAGLGQPIFTNYIPVLTHPLFFAGLIVMGSGIFVTLVNTFLTTGQAKRTNNTSLPLPTFGMIMTGMSVVIAFICFGLSYYFQGADLDLEALFWGGGHMLQFANTIAMATVWLYLSKLLFNTFSMRDSYAKIVFCIFLIFILPAPFIYFIYDIHSYENKEAFTRLMQYGLGPAPGIFAISIFMAISASSRGNFLQRIKELPWAKPEFSSLILSMILFALGSLISLTIQGYDTRIPAHYHGVIGGVTMAFMGITNHIMTHILDRNLYSKKISTMQPYIYGMGQALFVIGMFWAGSHGVARKTFGAAQNLDDVVKIVSMVVVGIGGLIAIIGGILFIVNSMMTLLPVSRRTKE